MRLSIALLLACFLVLPATAAAAPTLPEGFEEIALTTGSLGASTGVAFAPDGRAFVAEKDGYVRVVSPSGVVRPEPLLDISAHVNAWSDRGLLGIAVDKDFADNGYLYLLYVYESAPGDPSGPKVSRLTRVTVRPDNTIDGGETTILGTASDNPCPGSSNTSDCIPADFYWHTIGTVRVDPVDGSLWVGTGDANPELVGPTTYAPYDENTYRGKILHIDRNGNGLPGHPFCPGDGDLTHVCTKVYAKGFRNPFRFTLRPGQGPIVGDVGAESEEEVDLTVPGGNYGWPCYEGTVHTPVFQDSAGCEAEYAKEGTPDDTALAPDYSYEHNGGSSVLAGPLYTGAGYPPSYRNSIFIADYAQRWVKRLRLDDAGHVASVSDFASYPDGEGPLFVDMQTLPDGNVGYLDLGWSGTPGLREWRYSGDNHTPVPRASADPVGGRAPLVVHFDGSASSDPDGDDISYDWDFGDGQSGTGARPDHTYTAEGTYYATLTVRDDRGASARLQVGPITPGNLPPLPKITAPVSCSTFRYGSKIALAGSATDPQDGKVPGTALSWHVLQHHTNHLHDYGVFTGSKAIVPTGTDHDSDTYFIVTLTATDSRGLAASTSVRVDPETVVYRLASTPAGAPLSYAAETRARTLTHESAIGFKTTIAAAPSFTRGGYDYVFAGWSDRRPRQHTVTIPARDTTLTARYRRSGRASAARATAPLDKPRASAPIVKTCMVPGPITASPSGRVRVALDSADGVTASGYLKLTATDTRRGHKRATITLASQGYVVQPGERTVVHLRLTSAARSLLSHSKRLAVRLEFFAEDQGRQWVEHRKLVLAR